MVFVSNKNYLFMGLLVIVKFVIMGIPSLRLVRVFFFCPFNLFAKLKVIEGKLYEDFLCLQLKHYIQPNQFSNDKIYLINLKFLNLLQIVNPKLKINSYFRSFNFTIWINYYFINYFLFIKNQIGLKRIRTSHLFINN